MATKPNPGSDEAVELGCKCPRMDNCYGKGYRIVDNQLQFAHPQFVISGDCELHWTLDETEEQKCL